MDFCICQLQHEPYHLGWNIRWNWCHHIWLLQAWFDIFQRIVHMWNHDNYQVIGWTLLSQHPRTRIQHKGLISSSPTKKFPNSLNSIFSQLIPNKTPIEWQWFFFPIHQNEYWQIGRKFGKNCDKNIFQFTIINRIKKLKNLGNCHAFYPTSHEWISWIPLMATMHFPRVHFN
jgi:hypothetical protein